MKVASVIVQQPSKQRAGRTRYRITLECGCSWFEEYDTTAQVPSIGAHCHAGHSIRVLESVSSRPYVNIGVPA